MMQGATLVGFAGGALSWTPDGMELSCSDPLGGVGVVWDTRSGKVRRRSRTSRICRESCSRPADDYLTVY